MADATDRDLAEHHAMVKGFDIRIKRLDREIQNLQQQRQSVQAEREEEIASFQQRYQTSPKQAKKVMQMPQATPATESSLCKEMTSDEQVPAPQIIKAEPEEDGASTSQVHAKQIMQAPRATPPRQSAHSKEMTRSPAPEQIIGHKRSRSSSSDEVVTVSAAPSDEQPAQPQAVPAAAVPAPEIGDSPFNTDRFSILADTHPTVVVPPKSGLAYELHCEFCGANTNRQGDFLRGIWGFMGHINKSCRWKPRAVPSSEDFMVFKNFCKRKILNPDQSASILAGVAGAYVVEKKGPSEKRCNSTSSDEDEA